ncbi:MAG: addiction module antidote protein [Rhizomicrobium sp.]
MTGKRKTKLKTLPWDMADHIKTEKDVVAYIDAALEEGDPAFVAAVLGDIARSKGMAKIAKKAGLGRESLYKSLSKEGKPQWETIFKVIHALGYRLKLAA